MMAGDRVVYVPRNQPGTIEKQFNTRTRGGRDLIRYVVALDSGTKITAGSKQLMPLEEWRARFGGG